MELDHEEMIATVIVPDRQLSLAIGREGQNARLSAKLTGWKVDIKSSTEVEIERMKRQIDGDVAERAAVAPDAETVAAVAEAAPEVAEPAAAEPLPAVAEVIAEPALTEEETAIIAELEAEATVAAQPVEAEPVGPTLSAEEMLALESLDIEPEAQEEVIVEEVDEITIDEQVVWNVPEAVGGGPQIRFAEDILGAPAPRGGGTRRRGNRNRGPARGPARGPNRGGGARPAATPSDRGTPSGDDSDSSS